MAKHRYKFNERSLRYERSEKGYWERILSYLPTFIGGVLIAVGGLFGLFYYLGEGPFKQADLKERNEQLRDQFKQLNAQFNELDQTLNEVEERDDSLYRTLFGTEPIPANIRQAGVGGTDRYEHLRDRPNASLLVRTHSRLDRLAKKLKVQKNSFQEITKIAEQKREFLTHVPAIRPMRDDQIDRIASGFGRRFHPIYRILKMHEGIDFTADVGTPVHTTGDGVVKRIEQDRAGYGHNVLIDHGHGYKTLYAHLNRSKVQEGENVKRGDVIALSGNTGTSTGPHLHYEVIEKGQKVNPVDYFFGDLTPKEYARVVKVAEETRRSL